MKYVGLDWAYRQRVPPVPGEEADRREPAPFERVPDPTRATCRGGARDRLANDGQLVVPVTSDDY
jgi:hypothetical protein